MAPATGGTVICETDGNPYPDGVSYVAPPADLTIELEDGVVIDTTGGLNQGILALAIFDTAIAVEGGTNTSITTDAQGAFGVLGATTTGALDLTLDDIATTGDNATGIVASSEAGPITVNVNSIVTEGSGADGISATTNTGDISIDAGTVTVAGLGAKGIESLSDAGDITISANRISTAGESVGLVNPGAIGISATTGGVGSVAINAGDVATTGSSAIGIRAQTFDGLASVTADAVSTTGGAADGINLLATSGLTAVDAGTVSTTGLDARGIVATGAEGADIAFDTVTTTGDGATGVLVPASTGLFGPRPTARATITGGSVSTEGMNADAINAVAATGSISISVDGDVATSGDNSTAIYARAPMGVTIDGGADIATAGAESFGVDAAAVAGAVTFTGGGITVTGTDSTAVMATSEAGNVNVTTAGPVVASGLGGGGIFAMSDQGDVSVTTGDVSTVAAMADDTDASRAAIFASGANANVVGNGASITTGMAFGEGDAASVTAMATDGNASAIVNDVSAAGDGVTALRVTATNNAAATLNGDIQALGDDADAVRVTAGNLATGTFGMDATVSAADGDAIVLTSGNGSTLNNAGVIEANANGFAVAASGGALTVNNTGTLTSDIQFTDGADRVNNSGTFVVGPNPDFAEGSDVFANSGTVRFAPGATAGVSRTFAGLETFTNTGGLIALRNDVLGDTLTLPGNFAGSGDSTVSLDVALTGASPSDRLNIGGTATGSTTLEVNRIGPAGLNQGSVLVDAGAGTQANAFTLGEGLQSFGLIESDLVFNAADNTFSLVGTPGAAVYRSATFVNAARNMWHESADAVSAHLRVLRDGAWASGGGSPAGGMWLQVYGSREKQDNIRNVSNYGLDRSFDLGVEQGFVGGQAGFGFGGSAGDNGNFAFGVTGGYLNSGLTFNGVRDRTSFDAFNGGAYATFNSGSLFANALGKYDYFEADSESPSAMYSADFKGSSYGAQGEIGFRVGSDSFFIEPLGTIAYVRTDLNDLVVQNSTIEFIDDDGLRGKLGARIGGSFPGTLMNMVTFYAGGNYVKEFQGDDRIDFSNNNLTVAIDHRPTGDYGEAVVGLNVGSADGVTGFIEANGARGDEFKAFGARAGLRFQF